MLTCAEVTDLLLDLELGALPTELRVEVELHREGCEQCTHFMSTYQAVGPLVRGALEVPLPDRLQAELERSVMEALAEIA